MKLKNLVEGGNIKFEVDGELTSGGRIHLHDVSDTLQYVSEITNIPYQKLWDGLLGSAGKETTSGDIDVVVDIENYSLEEFYDYMSTTYDFVERLSGLQTVCLLVPVLGHASKKIIGFNGYVQVDFFFGNKEWLKFSHFSAGRKSKYKGMWRTLLLIAVIAARTKFTDYNEEGDLVAKVGEIFDLDKGIITQYRMKARRKQESGYVKIMKAVGIDDPEWLERYGDETYDEINITNPKDAAEFLFGPGTKPSQLDTFEKVKKLVSTLPKDEQFLVRKLFQIRSGYLLGEVPTKEEMVNLNEKVEKIRHMGSTILVHVNPTKEAFLNLIKKTSFGEVRGLVDTEGNFYFWDAEKLIHWPMATLLGINPNDMSVDPRLTIQRKYDDDFEVAYARSLEYTLKNSRYFTNTIFKFNESLTERVEKIEVNDLISNVFINPSAVQFRNMIKKSKYQIIRGLYFDNKFYFWNASDTIHATMAGKLGISGEFRFEGNLGGDGKIILTYLYMTAPDEIYNHKYINMWFDKSKLSKNVFILK